MSCTPRRITVEQFAQNSSVVLAPDALQADEWRLTSESNSDLLAKLRSRGDPLHEVIGTKALFGLKTGLNEAFIVDGETARRIDPKSEVTKPILFGKDIRRYGAVHHDRFVLYLHPDKDLDDYQEVRKHLQQFRSRLEERAGPQQWYELQQPAVNLLRFQTQPKIVYPIIANECRFALDEVGYLINDKAFILPCEDNAVLGVLNSRLANFYFAEVCAALEGKTDRYLEFRAQYVDRFPIPRLAAESSPRRDLEARVGELLSRHALEAAATHPHEKERIRREIEAMDRRIDQLVYQLYGLTDAEIRVVEEATT